jgi:hypothetical protein
MRIIVFLQEHSNTSIVKCDSKKLLNYMDSVKFVFIPAKDLDLATRKRIEKNLERKQIKIDGNTYVIYHDKNMKIQDPPKSSGSPNSDAKYFVFDDETGLLVQFIPQNSKTSCNYHKEGNERFYNLLGDCNICSCNGKKGSHNTHNLNGNSFTVESNHCHQLSTSSESAINIVLMPPGVGVSDHHYLKKCIKEC